MSAEPISEINPQLTVLEGGKSPEKTAPYEVYTGPNKMRALNEKDEKTGEYNIVRRVLQVDNTQADAKYRMLPVCVRGWGGSAPEVKWINSGLDAVKEDYGLIGIDGSGNLILENGDGVLLNKINALGKEPAFLPLDEEKKIGIFIHGYNEENGEIDMQRGWKEWTPPAPIAPVNAAPRMLRDAIIGGGILGTALHGGTESISKVLTEPQNPIPAIVEPDPRQPEHIPDNLITTNRINNTEPYMEHPEITPQNDPLQTIMDKKPDPIPTIPSTGGGWAAEHPEEVNPVEPVVPQQPETPTNTAPSWTEKMSTLAQGWNQAAATNPLAPQNNPNS